VKSGGQQREQFNETALPYLDALHTTALYLTRNPDDAADLLQDTMVRAWRFWHQFEPGTNCKAWLLTILHNVFRNNFRARQRAPAAVEFEDAVHARQEAEPTSATLRDPAEIAAFDVLDENVRQALHGLPHDSLDVVVLVDLQELTYEEAALVLGCPIGTIRSRLSRARQSLHKALLPYARDRRLVD